MCGIIGIFGENSKQKVEKGLVKLESRGKDGNGIYEKERFTLGHTLHSVVGSKKQPIVGEGVLVANCEIYNWKELNEKYGFGVDNDSELLLKLLDKKGLDCLDELDGVYAFAYFKDDKLYLVRDILGLKPIWYSHSDGFVFASEKKVLESLGYLDVKELNPREVFVYSVQNDKLEVIKRKFFDILPEWEESKDDLLPKLKETFLDVLKKRIPDRKFGVLFSGGIDSTYLAYMLKKLKCDFTCYVCYLGDRDMKISEDLVYSRKIAKTLGLDLVEVKVELGEVEDDLKTIVPLIEDSNVVKVGVALTFFKACKRASEDGCKVIFSGLGSEEIFAGYQRHKNSRNVNEECVSGLLKMYERALYRDDVITMYNGLELRVPFLDKKLVDFALKIPERYKLVDGATKVILRELAVKDGLMEDFAFRKKKAAQYGSNFHKALKKLSKKGGFARISEYMYQFYPGRNVRLGALVSSGKDGIYAMSIMMKQNYQIGCMVAVKSENPDSFMFHTPAVDLVEKQAESIQLPYHEIHTKGVKEEELDDLEQGLLEAKYKFKIEGIVTGALFSNYQRERIEKIADKLGLKVFHPLWHINQETEIRELLKQGYKFIITRVAADGLDESWLGREIGLEDLERLSKMKGFNVAGEGGEYETLMVSGPIFSQKLVVKGEKKMESSCRGDYVISEVDLE